ncbi:MerR family DNA-binding transcriptional regulator [Chloroflexota bacterium]
MIRTVGRAAGELGVSPASLRAWEAKGMIPVARRRVTNLRVYDDEAMAAIRHWLVTRNAQVKEV